MNNFLKQKNILKETKGFTLVEVLVSITLFTVVAVVGITAVLVAKSSYEKNQAIKATSDSLMFIMEDISRTARLGDFYHCIPAGSLIIGLDGLNEATLGTTQGCRGISYEPFWDYTPNDPSNQIIYVFAQAPGVEDGTTVGALFTRSIASTADGGTLNIGGGEHFQRVTPRNLNVDIIKSGFDVFNGENFNSQPRIIVRINGEIKERGQTTKLSLQTTISQRAIRVEP